MDAFQSLATASPAEKVECVSVFDMYERGLDAHVRENLQAEAKPAHPKALKLKVQPYEEKKEGNVHFWVQEVEFAMDAALLSDE